MAFRMQLLIFVMMGFRFRNRRTKEVKERAAKGQEPLDDDQEIEDPAASRKDLVARPPVDTASAFAFCLSQAPMLTCKDSLRP
jgi:hypothetical protein